MYLKILLFSGICLLSRLEQAPLVGVWQCDTKAGRYDAFTSFHYGCSGSVQFHSNGLVSSNSTDVFFPSGAHWQVYKDILQLTDSEGTAFAEYSINKLTGDSLVLVRKETVYILLRGGGEKEK